ncbi:MAG: hypothetical protein S4CHLAM45_11370 [Chlamydiales bacterium]|nr:hypothetical protein [Chlamydiales bacterium]MCH9619629.1 hypothetical protein [Chlamydiales bacterium]MCH9623235.1 hypothetical protein [Chlamydiales bacterium]
MRLIPFINLTIAALFAVTILGIGFYVNKDAPIADFAPLVEDSSFPDNPFQIEGEVELDKGPFALSWVAPHMLLPNLHSEVIYHGLSQRPDFSSSKPIFHLSTAGNDEIFPVKEGSPFYLSYQGEASSSQGNFPQNATFNGHPHSMGRYVHTDHSAPLWLEMFPQEGGRKLEVRVHMLDENGDLVSKPKENQTFTLFATPLPKERNGWELGGHRVDSTLLIRQKARWIGVDQFLDLHGGEEFAPLKKHHRIDFLQDEEIYSCFVKAGDALIWKDGRWKAPSSEETTLDYPLLVVKKIDPKVIAFELWDREGKNKHSLNLIRARDLGGIPDLEQEFRFVGAKTWAQFIVESGGERFILKPHDWLVLTGDGWVKLDSPEKIDDYVNQKIIGPLLVLDKMNKQGGKQLLVGHLFNASRTEMQPIELTATSNASYANSIPSYFKSDSMNGDD